jgi:hypothetical protein
MSRGVYESDVSIPGFEQDARCPHCGGELRIVLGERLGTLAVDPAPVVEIVTTGTLGFRGTFARERGRPLRYARRRARGL